MSTPPPLPTNVYAPPQATAYAAPQDDVFVFPEAPLPDQGLPVAGTEGMTVQQIEQDVLRGGRFRIFRYNFSVIVMSFQRGTEVRYFRSGEGFGAHAWPWTLLSMVVGWWGFPWGIFFTIQTLFTNCMGGKDVTLELLTAVLGQQRAAATMARAAKPKADIWLWCLRIFILLIPLSIFAAVASVEHPRR